MKKAKIDKNVEYQQMISYIFHMFETRHKAFNFMLILNLALVTAYGNLSFVNTIDILLPLVSIIVNFALIGFAYRSNKALSAIEKIAREIELDVGFQFLNKIEDRLKSPIKSTFYLLIIYWVFIILWILIFALSVIQQN